MNKQEFIEELKKLDLPMTEFVILSGGSMLMRGLREQTNDLDLSVTKSLAEKLNLYNCPQDKHGLYVPFDNVQMKNDMESFRFDIVDGYQCECLESVRERKMNWNREKDQKDIIIINEYLKNHPAK